MKHFARVLPLTLVLAGCGISFGGGDESTVSTPLDVTNVRYRSDPIIVSFETHAMPEADYDVMGCDAEDSCFTFYRLACSANLECTVYNGFRLNEERVNVRTRVDHKKVNDQERTIIKIQDDEFMTVGNGITIKIVAHTATADGETAVGTEDPELKEISANRPADSGRGRRSKR